MRHYVSDLKPGAWALEHARTPADAQGFWQGCTLAMPFWEDDTSGGNIAVEDFSGLGLHGLLASQMAWITGPAGRGLRFTGTSTSKVTVADPPADYLDGCSAWTVEIWVYPTDVTGTKSLVGKYYPATDRRSWRLYIVDGQIGLQASQDGLTALAKATTDAGLSANNLYHIVVVWPPSAGTWQAWVNGVARTVSSGFGYSGVFGAAEPLIIGRRSDGYGLLGDVFGLRFWQRALAAEEIRRLYEEPWRQYEQRWPIPGPGMALEHAGGAAAGPWLLAGEVNAGVEELYIGGLLNGTSYDVYCKTKDTTGNESSGCSPETETPAGAAGGPWAALPRGLASRPRPPAWRKRYK